MLSVNEITSDGRFQSCRAEWEDLLTASGAYSPFLSHDWFRCCLAGYGEGKELFILHVSDGPELIGIAPFWRYRDAVRGIPVMRIAFITSPDTPFVDFIVKRDRRSEVLGAIRDHLYAAKRGVWDILTLLQWPIESETCNTFVGILRTGRSNVFVGTSSKTPYIPRRSDWEKFFQSRSTRFRKTRRNIINRMAKLKNVHVECIRRDVTGSALGEIVAVSGKSWKHRDGVSIASRQGSRRFFELLTEAAGQQGWLLVWLLKIDQTVVAMEYDLEYRGAVYALRADFDDAYQEYSPGAYLEYHVIKYVFDQGYAEYNTGPGLNAYKLHWTDEFKDGGALYLYNNNFKPRAIALLEERWLPALRRIRHISLKSGPNP
jgi:CelD/BcsL family acetyltransferase involved in cellulose biosynthesis